jgi:hypothetical protein
MLDYSRVNTTVVSADLRTWFHASPPVALSDALKDACAQRGPNAGRLRARPPKDMAARAAWAAVRHVACVPGYTSGPHIDEPVYRGVVEWLERDSVARVIVLAAFVKGSRFLASFEGENPAQVRRFFVTHDLDPAFVGF